MDGIVFYDDEIGIWSGSFVDSTHDGAIQLCLNKAKEISESGSLPEDGRIVVVNLVVDENATQKMAGRTNQLIDRAMQNQSNPINKIAQMMD